MIERASRFTDGMRSSASDEWLTPRWLYDLLDATFHFAIDAAATVENHLAPAYFTMGRDALKHPWTTACAVGRVAERQPEHHAVFVNPPFSKIAEFTAKAGNEACNGRTVVLIAANRPDAAWWRENVKAKAAEIIEPDGRIQFGVENDGHNRCPFPTAIVVYRPHVSGVVYEGPRRATLFRPGLKRTAQR